MGRWGCEHLTGWQLTLVSYQVSQGFADLIATSQFLKYRLELFAAGLVENPHFSCSLEEGRKRVKEYADVWENLDAIKKRELPVRPRGLHWDEMVPVGRGLLAGIYGRSVFFIRVPCTTTGQQGVEEWTVDAPASPFWPCAFAVYSPEDVLALVGCMHP